MDLLLERETDKPNTHDLIFVNGGCPVTSDRTDVVTQRVYIRLRTFLGEWYLNAPYGVPWLERILGHKGRKSTIDAILQEQIQSVSGVAEITEFTSSFDNARREYSCSFRVRTDSGQLSNTITI